MTDAIKGINVLTGASSATTQQAEQPKVRYRRSASRLDMAIAKALLTSKSARGEFQNSKQAEYLRDIDGFTEKEAKDTAKIATKNEVRAARVDHRELYIDENKYNAAKAADTYGYDHVLIKDDTIKGVIADNPEDFYVNGEFSSDATKRRIGKYTGFDNKGDLNEQRAMAADYGIKRRKARKFMTTAGYDAKRDLTWLYKTLAALGVLGVTGGVGAAMGIPFESNVYHINADGSVDHADMIKTVGGKGLPGGLKGLIGGLIPSIALATVVKDDDPADILNGLSAEAVVAKPDKNIKSRVKGRRNQKLMREILKMENLTPEDKAYILKLAYGELTAKRLNKEELVGAYEIAKFLNAHPEIRAENYDDLPGENDGEIEAKPIDTPIMEFEPIEIDDNSDIEQSKCTLEVAEIGQNKIPYNVVKNDNPFNLTMGKYRHEDGTPLTDFNEIMALRNHIFGENVGLKVGQIWLDPVVELSDSKKYVYYDGKVIQGTSGGKVDKYYHSNPGQKTYSLFDCNGNVYATGVKSKEEVNSLGKKLGSERDFLFIPKE